MAEEWSSTTSGKNVRDLSVHTDLIKPDARDEHLVLRECSRLVAGDHRGGAERFHRLQKKGTQGREGGESSHNELEKLRDN